jgi:hypothetical protein
LQWLQDPSQISEDNLNSVSHEAGIHQKRKNREYLKELATHNENRNITDLYRGMNAIKKGYQPRTNSVKDENCDVLAGSHNILNRWNNYFFQLLNVHRDSDVRQIEKTYRWAVST